MPQGSKSAYTSKQKRQAHKIEKSAKERGYSQERAEEIGWATVNKQHGGGKRKQSGSKSDDSKSGSSKRGSSSGGSKSGSSNKGGSKSK